MEFLGVTNVAALTVIAYLIGEICKVSSLNDKWIPVVCGITGAILGVVAYKVMPGFPAEDIITALAVGIVSGMAATGFDQIGKQLSKND